MTLEKAVEVDSATTPELDEDVKQEVNSSTTTNDVNDGESSNPETPELDDNEAPVEKEEQVVPLSRLNEVIGKRRDLERELVDYKQQLTDLQQAGKPKTEKEPLLEDFDYIEDDYTNALVDYRVNKQIAKQESENKLALEQNLAIERMNVFNSKAATYNEANPSYKDAVTAFGETTLANHVVDAILDSDNAPAIHHALLNDLDLLSNLENMPVGKMNRELGRLEDSLIKGIKKIPAKKISNAPDPISIDSSGSAAKVKPSNDDIAKMTGPEYRAYREGK